MSTSMVDELLKTIEQFKYNKRYIAKVEDTIPSDGIDPTTGPSDDLSITVRTLGVTFESIYKNIASYPNSTDMSNENLIKKIFFLENDQKIYINTEITEGLTSGKIVTKITGDTSLNNIGLVRTIVYDDNNIDTVYGVL